MRWIPVGKLHKPHGLKGELKFQPDVLDPALIEGLRRVRIGDKGEAEVAGIRGHGQKLIIRFAGIDRVEDAQPLAGQTLHITEDQFPSLPEGEYYWFQILGLHAYDEDGTCYGTVDEIIETGSNDVYVVRDGDHEVMLPMIEDVVKSIDPEQGRLTFHVVPGLLDP